MGQVYRATDTKLKRQVAIKILPPSVAADHDRLARFQREAEVLASLNHPNIATIHDIGESAGVRFIVMEYVEGHTLAEKIAGGSLAVGEILDIAVQVADALEAAHTKGITHRDIKPGNLMLTPRGQVKVLDFGIAKTVRGEGAPETGEVTTNTQTAVGLVIGSVPYMSPEQVLGHEVDHRSDLFSLGVTLYELATGRHPFAGVTATETMDRILHAQPLPIATLDDGFLSELERITFKCLEKGLSRRYQSARDLMADLRELRQRDGSDRRRSFGDHRRHNLPAQLTSFVGRQREIEEIRPLLGSTRLLTLTGAGGCGKTRLALQVAAELIDDFRDGVWLVDLAPLSDPDLVTPSVASVFKVQDGPSRPLAEGVCNYLRSRQVLLVMDNCEHLIAACARLAEILLLASPGSRILATSRESLGLSGETVWRVPSLSVPSPQGTSTEAVARSEAACLFIDRATAVVPTFTISDGNAPVVEAICRRLDGIPLAIELAAARMKVLSVEQISERLNDRFRLLTGGSRTAVARQRTLEAAVDWSYNLLSKIERRFFCRLSVFVGGWTLEAAEIVCAGGAIRKAQILDLLSNLVDKSLVSSDDDATGHRRYRFLETVRQYGREHILRLGDAEQVRHRHLDFFLTLARRAEPQLTQADQGAWLTQLQLDHDNLRSALEWSLAEPDRGHDSLELAGALFWFWLKRGHLDEGRRWLQRALAAGGTEAPALRAKALMGLSHMMWFQSDHASMLVQLEESLALGRQINDLRIVAFSLFLQAFAAVDCGRLDQGVELAKESRAAAASIGDFWLQCVPCFVLAAAEWFRDSEQASRLQEEALKLSRQTGDRFIIGISLSNLAEMRVIQKRYSEAQELGIEGVLLCEEAGDRRGIALCLESLGVAQAAQGRSVRAAHLWGAADQLLESVGAFFRPQYKQLRDRYFDAVRDSLGDEAFQAASSEGRAMSLTKAIQYALSETSHEGVPRDAS